ncbi:MAG TPA: hypothetical protein VMY42_21980 [Thermoguttaceae bacterium]|nr:hypothetical protein [Thermoguttaceae bacterium]
MTRVRNWLVVAMTVLLVAALVHAAQAQAPESGRRGGGMMRGSFLGLLSLEQVQKELKLAEDQVGKVKEIGEKLRTEMSEQFAGLREIEDRQQQRAKIAELADQFDEKARGLIREVLSGEQMMRLYQIRLQVRGAVYGVNNQFIAGRLKFTDEQKEKAAALEKATEEKIFAAFSGLRDLSEEARRAKFAELREKIQKIRNEADEKALGLLTADQKEAIEKLKGEPFELQR